MKNLLEKIKANSKVVAIVAAILVLVMIGAYFIIGIVCNNLK